jgi:hypothetical protein
MLNLQHIVGDILFCPFGWFSMRRFRVLVDVLVWYNKFPIRCLSFPAVLSCNKRNHFIDAIRVFPIMLCSCSTVVSTGKDVYTKNTQAWCSALSSACFLR